MKPQNEYDSQYNQSGSQPGYVLPQPASGTGPASQSIPAGPAPAAGNAPSAFPPLGATLPQYAPPAYGPDSRLNQAGRTDRPRPGANPHASKGWKQRIKRAVIVLLVIGLLAGGYVGFKLLYNASKTFNGGLLGLIQNDKLDGEDVGRVNILLAGNSADDVGHAGGDLTDSIMVVSLDTKNNTAFMLSVPRDLWVSIPGNGYGKINSAFVYGKADKFSEAGYPAGGMGALQKVIERDFEIDINYYALVNYSALRDAVNAVGGIDVNIQSTDPRGLYDPSRDWSGPRGTPLVRLKNGSNTLSGQQALNLARARGDEFGAYGYGLGDFTRAANQRLMLAALKDKATSAGVASNPVKLGGLLDSIGNNVQTDFQTSEVRRLVELGQKIPSSSIKSVSLNDVDGENLLKSYRSSNGQSALIPATGVDDYTAIIALIDKLMAPPPAPAESTTE